MHYQPVVDRFPIPVALDPIAAVCFAAVFVAVALATVRRPSRGLAALMFVQPFAWYHFVLSTAITFPKVVLAAVAVGVIGAPGVREALRDKRLLFLAWPLAAMLAATALSLAGAHDRAPTIRQTLKMAEYLTLAIVSFVAFRLDRDDELLRRSFAYCAIAVALSALADEFLGASSGLRIHGHQVPRIAGVLEGPNQLAGFIEVATAILGAWSIRERTALTDAALALCGCALMLTFSRGGIAGDAVVAIVLGAVMGRAAIRGLAPLGIGVLCGAAGDAVWSMLARSNDLFRFTTADSDYAGGVGNRSELWRAAWYFFRTHPLAGIGAGNFELDLPQAGVAGVRTHANNWYLQSLAEGGVALFASVMWFLVSSVRALWKNAARNPWTCAALAATLALALHQTADYLIFYPKVGGPWIVLVAIGIAVTEP